ncbi:hypothetical protein AX17_004244 [Amanita inopinata Kibby_2008]|nr:hypothetical protein AX17_004244 [Amanita inopinata Kibby_2008]
MSNLHLKCKAQDTINHRAVAILVQLPTYSRMSRYVIHCLNRFRRSSGKLMRNNGNRWALIKHRPSLHSVLLEQREKRECELLLFISSFGYRCLSRFHYGRHRSGL